MSTVIKSVKKVSCTVLIVVMMLAYWVPQEVSAATSYTTGSLLIMSANLKTTTGLDLIKGSNNRATNFAALMGLYQPDSIGLQEVSKDTIPGSDGQSWNAWFNDNIGTGNLVNYASTGKKSDYGTDLYGDCKEYCLILYNKTKYTLVNSGGIWIGKKPASSLRRDVFKSTDSGETIEMNHSRVLSWALLKNTSTGASYLHVNCHPDTRLAGGIGSMQTEVIIKKVQALVSLYKVPVVLTGDFNYDEYTNDRMEFNDYYKFLTDVISYDGVTSGLVDGKYATTDHSVIGTSCGYASKYDSTKLDVLDRVCFMNRSKMLSLTGMSSYSYSVSKSRVVRAYTFDGVNYDTKNISDHSPVYTKLTFNYKK